MAELLRFRSLFNQQVLHTLGTLEHVPISLWQAVPADSNTNYLGERVNRITIEALVRHLCQAEQHWANALAETKPGQAIAPPASVTAADEVAPGVPLLQHYRATHETTLVRIQGFDEGRLATELVFAGRRFTVMGFLWAVYGHHAYHFGQIDLLLRQQGHMPPEFLEYAEMANVIA